YLAPRQGQIDRYRRTVYESATSNLYEMSTSSSALPTGPRPEPGPRRPRFSREEIASAALQIADEEGFAAVSMRRVAAQLGAGTMTLYHYVQSKDDLVALMDDALMAEVLVPEVELPLDD